MQKIWVLFLVALCLLVACGDDSAADGNAGDGGIVYVEGPPGPPGTPGEDFVPPPPPPPVSCSEGDDCVEDGIEVAARQVQGVIDAICEHYFRCCSASELRLRFGPIDDATKCKAQIGEIARRGINPNLPAGYLIGNLSMMGQTLNAQYGVLNPAGIDACQESVEAMDCDMFMAAVPQALVCEVQDLSSGDDLCGDLIVGIQQDGEPCYSTSNCVDGFVCRYTAQDSDIGVCAPAAVEGSACSTANDCSGLADGFCNLLIGKCELLRGVGETCAFADPTLQERQALSVPCKFPLTCDPVAHVCVDQCQPGRFCDSYYQEAGRYANCAAGQVCDVTTLGLGSYVPDSLLLSNRYSAAPASVSSASRRFGICAAPFADGAECTEAQECASKACVIVNGKGTCDPRKKLGEDCTGVVACETGTVCDAGATNTCIKSCLSCDSGVGGAEYCGQNNGMGAVGCFAKQANDKFCSTDSQCASNFCDNQSGGGVHTATGMCKAPAAVGGTCAKELGCNAASFCNTGTYYCVAKLATAADCSAAPANACGKDSDCVDHDGDNNLSSPNTCQLLGGAGAGCLSGYWNCSGVPNAVNNYLFCNPVDNKCYFPYEYPDAASCSYGSDCVSGVCHRDAVANPTPSHCLARLADGADCDPLAETDPGTTQGTTSLCADDSFCNTADRKATMGKCEKKRLAGQPCPGHIGGGACMGSDCILSGFSELVCGPASLAPDTLLCDGQ